MKLETLYTLDSKGKIRIFECEVNYGMYSSLIESPSEFGTSNFDGCSVITRTGLLGSKLIAKEELVKSGKQKRTIQQQAEFQANSLWSEKWDEGYKSISFLTSKIQESNIISTSIPMTKESAIIDVINSANKLCSSWTYTNKNWDELPQLAHKFKDIKNPQFPYYIQPKLNGVRCLIKAGANKDGNFVKLCSRGGQYYQIPHIENAIRDLFQNLENIGVDPFSVILDGEIYKHGIPLQDISGAARKEENSMFASNGWLEYHIYDVINLNKLDESQEDRINNLRNLGDFSDLNHIKIVKTLRVNSKDQIKFLHDEFISQGYEGAILRDPKGIYEFNNRSRSLLKVKEYQDEEFKLVGCGFDPNKTLGESFYFVLENNINSLTFKSRPTGTIAQKEEWYNNESSWINKKATVRFFERSKDGLPQQNCVRSKDTEVLIEHLRPTNE